MFSEENNSTCTHAINKVWICYSSVLVKPFARFPIAHYCVSVFGSQTNRTHGLLLSPSMRKDTLLPQGTWKDYLAVEINHSYVLLIPVAWHPLKIVNTPTIIFIMARIQGNHIFSAQRRATRWTTIAALREAPSIQNAWWCPWLWAIICPVALFPECITPHITILGTIAPCLILTLKSTGSLQICWISLKSSFLSTGTAFTRYSTRGPQQLLSNVAKVQGEYAILFIQCKNFSRNLILWKDLPRATWMGPRETAEEMTIIMDIILNIAKGVKVKSVSLRVSIKLEWAVGGVLMITWIAIALTEHLALWTGIM